MASPNLIEASSIYGKVAASNLTTTSATTVLNNGALSNKTLKVNTVNITNTDTATRQAFFSYNNQANAGGTSFAVIANVSIPAGSAFTVIDKETPYYLEENTSFVATAATANTIVVTIGYEEINA